jgi:hypothetical protein
MRLTEAEVDRVLGVAQAAPSLDNSQPWSIEPVGEHFEVRTDVRRAVPVADPDGRQRVVSTGAALFNLRLALRVLGRTPDTRLFPDPDRPDLVARVTPRSPRRGTGWPPASSTNRSSARRCGNGSPSCSCRRRTRSCCCGSATPRDRVRRARRGGW